MLFDPGHGINAWPVSPWSVSFSLECLYWGIGAYADTLTAVISRVLSLDGSRVLGRGYIKIFMQFQAI